MDRSPYSPEALNLELATENSELRELLTDVARELERLAARVLERGVGGDAGEGAAVAGAPVGRLT